MPFSRRKAAISAAVAFLSTQTYAELSSDYVLTAPIARRGVPRRNALYKRDTNTVALKNDVNNMQYTMNVTVGTPPQTITVQLDTGSTDVWFLTPGACTAAQANPGLEGNITNCGGTYDMSKSSTGKIIQAGAGQFEVQYQDTTGAQGDYFSDTLQVGSWTLQDYTMGQALQANTTPGLIGIGFDTLEAIVGDENPGEGTSDYGNTNSLGYSILSGMGFNPSQSSSGSSSDTPDDTDDEDDSTSQQPQTYPAILSSFLNAGYIKTRSFSLWLDDLDASTGTIMFGGFDTAKFQGDRLQMLPMINDSSTGIIDRYNVALTSVGVTLPSNGGQTSTVQTPREYAVAATLDSGTSVSDIPEETFNVIVAAMGAQMDDTAGGYVVDCTQALQPGSVDFQFGGTDGPVIAVPFSEIVLPLVDAITGGDIKDQHGRGLCQIGLNPLSDADASYNGAVIGDTVLRSAYVYYNLDSFSIGLAQTAYDSTSSTPVEVSSNSTLPSPAASVPGSVYVPTPTISPSDTPTSTPDAAEATATGITASPATTFDAGRVTGAPTSYASLPTVAGNPSPRVSAELKGTPLPGDEVSGTIRSKADVLVGCGVAVAGVMVGAFLL